MSKHFYYVKPARGFELWPEMGTSMPLVSTNFGALACDSNPMTPLFSLRISRSRPLGLGAYDEKHSTFVGEGTAAEIRSLSIGAACL